MITELTQDWGSRLLEGTNKTLRAPGPGRKEQGPHKGRTQACPWVSRSPWWRRGSAAHCCTVGGTECRGVCLGPLEGPSYLLIFITSTLVWCQVKQQRREHSSAHQQKIGLKIYGAWPCPSEQDPVSPSVSLSHQEASMSLLSLSIRVKTG